MGKYASKVVGQAQAWLGKKESNGTHKEIIDVYNSHKPIARGYAVKYTDAWCSTFVSAVAVKLGYTDIIPTECGCEKHIQLFKNIGAWVENENRVPNAGDIIFYDWEDNGIGDNKGNSDHVGIVEKVEGNTIIVIEGNIDNAVGRRTLKVNGRYIRGYGVPKYDKEETTTIKPIENVTNMNRNTVGQRKKLKANVKIWSSPNLNGTYYDYLKNTEIEILENVSENVDKIRVIKTGRVAYINIAWYASAYDRGTVGKHKKLKANVKLWSKPELNGTSYSYLKNTEVKILENVNNDVDKVKAVRTGRVAYINIYWYK